MPAHSLVVEVRQGTPYRRLATIGGEKCGLALLPSVNLDRMRPTWAGSRAEAIYTLNAEVTPKPVVPFPLQSSRRIGFCWNDKESGLLQKINMLPTISQIEDKFPMGVIFVYAAPNLSGADRSAPVFKR